jgi:hypothetical protein
MKKFIIASGLLFASAVQGMDLSSSCRDEYNKYLAIHVDAIRNFKQTDELFNTSRLGAALLEEAGGDTFALEAYGLFHSYKFDELLAYWIINYKNMHPANAEKYRELLIFITPIVAESENIAEQEREFIWDAKYDEFKKTVFEFVCAPEKATPDQIQFPLFCYEMLGKAMIDADTVKGLSDRLSIFLEDMYRFVDENFTWDKNTNDGDLLNFIDERENEWGNCTVGDVWPKL